MKTSQEIEVEIERIETEIKPIMGKLDAAIIAFSSEMVGAVESWMRKELSRKIEDNAETVNARGVKPLRATKADFENLIKQIPSICEEATDDQSIWPHRQSESSIASYQTKSRESFFPATFRRAINPLGKILEAHDLLGASGGYADAWKHGTKGQFEYQFNPGFDGRNFESVIAYDEIKKQYKKLNEALDEKKKELAKAKANELWNEA